MPPSLAGLDERRLCQLLARAGHDLGGVVVVCDGVVKPHTPASSEIAGIDLIYSGPHRTADDLIVHMVDQDSAPRRLTIVTNDRQIQKAARRRRAKVRSCEALIHDLAGHAGHGRGPSAPIASTKPDQGRLTDQQVRKWLEEFGLDSDGPPDSMVDEKP